MRLFERIGLLIWKARNHDQIVCELEEELEEAQAEIAILKQKLRERNKNHENAKEESENT